MGARDTWRAAAGPYLRPGEEIQAVIPAEALFPNPVPVATVILMLRRASRLVIATNQRILIFRRTNMGALGAPLGERSRDIATGPPHSIFVHYRTKALGDRLYIHRRWFNDVKAADAALQEPVPPAAP